MTITTNGFSTYAQIGRKEDVSDLITNISPSETPCFSMIPKFKAINTLYQWQTEALDAPAANAQLEGDDVVPATTTPTTMLNNQTQISYKSLAVTETASAVSAYGRGSEYDHQVIKRGKELKTDIEFSILKNVAKAAGSSASARVTAGLGAYITNVSNGAASAGTGADVVVAASSTALTYTMLSTAQQAAYEDGGSPTVMVLPPALKTTFSNLSLGSDSTTAEVRYTLSGKGSGAVAVGTVEQWLSDFGTVDVMPNRQMARSGDAFLGACVYLIDKSKWRLGMLQNIEVQELAKTGLSDRAVIRAQYVLEVSAPNAHAAVVGVV
jgi:hypothetical protein|tara:strand:+ start:443 stop:1414 length:972 start_codon:yes stop_codon:yes gene_type:complete